MKIRNMLYGDADPYFLSLGDMLDIHKFDLQGWNSTHPIFGRLIAENTALRICEVGSWKGASAIEMAGHVRKHTDQGSLGDRYAEIVCVDTWLGSIEMWLEQEKRQLLSRGGAMPSVWPIFRNNVLVKGLDRLITPFPATSRCAAQFFAAKKVQFDLVYIDASHEYEDVLADIRAYAPLAPIVFGDDYDWPGVREAVMKSATDFRKTLYVEDEKWVLR